MELIDPLFYLAPLVTGVVVSMAIIPVMMKLAPSLGLLDKPSKRKIHRGLIPRVGGFGIVIGSVLSIVFLVETDTTIQSYIAGSLVLFLFGVWDDRLEIGHYTKFVGQFIAAMGVVVYGDLYVTRFPFLDGYLLPAHIAMPFTVFAVMGMINATNHSDGLDGLAGGESLISLGAIGFLAYLTGSMQVVIIALAVIGGIFGFLWYNTHPARVFMGDSGSQFLGFTLAVLVLILTQRVDHTLSPAVVLLLLGLPVIDIIAVLFIRIRSGMDWFKASKNHIHHRLLDLGFVHQDSVIIIYTVQTVCVTTGVLLRYQSDWIISAIYLLLCAGLLVLISVAERTGWDFENKSSLGKEGRVISHKKMRKLLVVLPRRFLAFSVPLYFIATSLIVTNVPRGFSVLSGLVFALLALEVLFGAGPRSVLRRALIYIVAISVVYLGINFQPDVLRELEWLIASFFTLLALAFAVAVRFSPRRRQVEFNTTAMDYLVVIVLIATLVATKGQILGNNIMQLVVGMIIILYSCELLSTESRERWNLLSAGSLLATMMLALRGLF